MDALVCPAGKDRIFLWDLALSGFGVAAFASGKKVYVAQYRQNGRSRRATIGEHGRLTPEQARTAAKQLLGDATRGIDTIGRKKAARSIPTFRQIAAEYIAGHVEAKRKPRTAEGYEALLRLHILPAIGAVRITELRRRHIGAMHSEIESKGAANRAVSLTSAILNFAAGEHDGLELPPNPAKGIIRNPEKGRERFLSDDELARLGAVLALAETTGLPWESDPAKPGAKHAPKPEHRVRVIDPFAIAAIRLLILTGARMREILDARWDWLDSERGFLNLPDSKTGRKVVFLSDAALAVFAALPRIEENPFIIAGLAEGRPRADLHAPWRAVRKGAELDGVRLHDLRHSFASVGAGAGLGLPIIGKLLGHASPAMTARYSHFGADPVRRAANAIGDTITAAMAGKATRQ